MEATEYLCGREVGECVVIIGGSLTGCEIAYDLILKGKKSIVVEDVYKRQPQKGKYLPLPDMEIQPFEDGTAAIAFFQPANLYRCAHSSTS